MAAAAAAFVTVVAARAGGDDVDVDAFRKSADRPAFCKEASPLDLSRSEELTPHDRRHVIEDLRQMAPDDMTEEFDRLLAWYEHPEEDDRERSKQASVRVGEFIERSCDDINIGGIRT
ncbi:hypothetical protein EJ357_17470 [Streptomyces cyaneochromogenes]|uniref:Uncharacterized protein n=1 Tax=Streptomyces cyaneochromogenes TaxID=2496836 RepID=A0A3Q9EMW0_9ACTN|nr:hypothetical protein [Streptomyces cyaneochromogenes]AZQ35060.1 hypothetical protein EJ357_17470 [Streptomyces cyaneochromogenes]